MDSVFRSAREKLEKEHRESRETGKLKLEREKKDKEAAERQRQAVEASQRARRLEAIESQMMKVRNHSYAAPLIVVVFLDLSQFIFRNSILLETPN